MQSNDKVDLTDFMRNAVTTAEDVEMLRRVRELDRLDPHEYLRFLEQFSEAHPPTREIPERHEPFGL